MHFDTTIPAHAFQLPASNSIQGFSHVNKPLPPLARLTTIDPGHYFDPNFFNVFRLWWENDDTREPLYISGPTGCGKTSTVTQLLTRLNAPHVSITCRRRMDKNELIGSYGIDSKTGNFTWYDGPAAAAWRHGLVLIINEFTLAPPEVWVSSNDILEGDDLTLEKTGEVLRRHENTRVIITDNALAREGSNVYEARMRQDQSVCDRFWHTQLHYLDEKEEFEMLLRKTNTEALGLDGSKVKTLLKTLIQFAHKTRGNDEDLPTVSTRTIIRMAKLFFKAMRQELNLSGDSLSQIVQIAFSGSTNTEKQLALDHLAKFIIQFN